MDIIGGKKLMIFWSCLTVLPSTRLTSGGEQTCDRSNLSSRLAKVPQLWVFCGDHRVGTMFLSTEAFPFETYKKLGGCRNSEYQGEACHNISHYQSHEHSHRKFITCTQNCFPFALPMALRICFLLCQDFVTGLSQLPHRHESQKPLMS